MSLLVHFQVHAFGQQHLNRVRVAENEGCDATLHIRAITGADDIELPGKSRRNTVNGVGGKRPGKAMQRPELVVVPNQLELTVFLVDPDTRGHRYGQLASRSLDLQLISDVDPHAIW